uniref:Protein SPEC3 n=1 Tax=Ciona savignyi TaxID=51511 RepID=H2ZG09_CIOSA
MNQSTYNSEERERVQPAEHTCYNAVPTPNPQTIQIQTQVSPPTQYVSYTTQTAHQTSSLIGSASVPVMPMWCAITCLVINCLLPGIGTIMASFSILCCAQSSQKNIGGCTTFCLNFWIGWLQLITVPLVLFGWVWAIVWGVGFIQVSSRQKKETIVTTSSNSFVPTSQPTNVVIQNGRDVGNTNPTFA